MPFKLFRMLQTEDQDFPQNDGQEDNKTNKVEKDQSQENENQEVDSTEEPIEEKFEIEAEIDEATGLCIRYEEKLFDHFLREAKMF